MSHSILSFILDNKIVEIDFKENEKYTPTTTLLQYLRSLPNHKGVKEGCAEGDCGACTVVIAKLDSNNKLNYTAIDSCLVFLPMIHGKQVITVENLGTSKNMHPVQQVLVDNNGSQCGYCTPGIVMSLFSYFKNEKHFNRAIAEDYLVGNLCRCTGYKSILYAAESLDINEKDIFHHQEKEITALLKSMNVESTLIFKNNLQTYFKLFSIYDALDLKDEYPEALLISGSTDIALKVTKGKQLIPLIIDLSDIKELKKIEETDNDIRIGSGVILDQVKDIAKNNFPALYEILKVFGSKQIRNLATLGGNIGSASPIGDTLPVLIAYKAKLKLESIKGDRSINLCDFITGYRKTKLEKNELITEIIIPKNDSKNIVRSYKISKRKDLDISTVSGGFRIELSESNIVEDICLAYGGMAEMTKRAQKTEEFVLNKEWSRENVEKAMEFISEDFIPISDARSGAEARMIMAKNLLMKFWTESNKE